MKQTPNRPRSPFPNPIHNPGMAMGPKQLMAQAREALRRLRLIPKRLKQCMIVSIIAILLTFLSAVFSHLAKNWSMQKSDLFLSPNFKMMMEHQWYLFFAGWKMFNLINAWVTAKLAAMVSDAMFLFYVVIFGYIVIDFAMFWWDFNDDFYIYLDLLWTLIVLLRRCVLPYKPETIAKIKSLF